MGAVPLRAQILTVPADDSTIQAAIDAANDGDTIVVAPGTYTEPIHIIGEDIVLESSGGAAQTTIDVSDDSGARAVILSGLQPTIRGVTITGGDPSHLGSLSCSGRPAMPGGAP